MGSQTSKLLLVSVPGPSVSETCTTDTTSDPVGPAKSAAAGEVVEVNQDLVSSPKIANEDPYEKGWMVILKPADWDAVKAKLVPGSAVQAPYEAKMTADGFAGCA